MNGFGGRAGKRKRCPAVLWMAPSRSSSATSRSCAVIGCFLKVFGPSCEAPATQGYLSRFGRLRMRKIILSGLLAAALGGCVSTQEIPLAPNMVRIDTEAGGRLFVGQAVPQTMRRAAEATIARGYTHFRLEQANLSQGSRLGGATVTNYGGGFVGVQAQRVQTASASATVLMFHAHEAGAQGAFEAQAVLRQYSQ